MLRFFFSSRRRHTRYIGDWSSDVCSSDLKAFDLDRRNLLASNAFRQLSGGKKNQVRHSSGRLRHRRQSVRSEERRVGKECRARWSAYHEWKKGVDEIARGQSRVKRGQREV